MSKYRTARIAAAVFIRALRTEAILREWEVNLGRRSGFERLSHVLLELHRRLRLNGAATDGAIEMPLTQEELADCLGMTTVYVNRLLGRMRREGLLVFDAQGLIIEDPEELRRAAGFDPGYLEDFGPPDGSSDSPEHHERAFE